MVHSSWRGKEKRSSFDKLKRYATLVPVVGLATISSILYFTFIYSKEDKLYVVNNFAQRWKQLSWWASQ